MHMQFNFCKGKMASYQPVEQNCCIFSLAFLISSHEVVVKSSFLLYLALTSIYFSKTKQLKILHCSFFSLPSYSKCKIVKPRNLVFFHYAT